MANRNRRPKGGVFSPGQPGHGGDEPDGHEDQQMVVARLIIDASGVVV